MENCHHFSKSKQNIEVKGNLITVNFMVDKAVCTTLENSIKKYYQINEIAKKIVTFDVTNDGLANKKVRELAIELAKAVDKNDVQKIKELKILYANSKEFRLAKALLDENCKKVWDVLNKSNKYVSIPKEGMIALGISNEPGLDYLLADTLKFFEKQDNNITSKIIESILANDNLSYTIEDVHKYLRNKCKNEGMKLAVSTLQYFIKKHDYNSKKLLDLGIDKSQLRRVYSLELFINDVKSVIC